MSARRGRAGRCASCTVFVRFYEELNDFLPEERQKRTFEARFHEGDTVKALVEALGVPHTEIDLVLADGESVSFEHRLADGQRLSVYPVFESFDIGGVTRVRPTPLREPRFLLDVHLGRLACALRLLGFDAGYANDRDDAALAALAAAERRILLTRDRGLLKRRAVTHGYLVRSLDPLEQLGEVLRRFDLAGGTGAGQAACRPFRPFSRCLRCNLPLAELTAADIAAEKKTGRIPPRIGELYDRFKRCPACGRVYWPGTHWEHMARRIPPGRIAGASANP